MKVEVIVSTGKVGSERRAEIEVDDEATDDAIEEVAKEAMFELIEWTWKRVTDEPAKPRGARR